MPDKSTEVRLKHLLDTKEIKPEEYKLLMKSIPKPRLWIKMFEFLMNPFEKISYTNSITTIILSILLAGYSYYCTDFMHLNKGVLTFLCKFFHSLNSTFKFYQKISHSLIPILDGHAPFFGNIINRQIQRFKYRLVTRKRTLVFGYFSELTV